MFRPFDQCKIKMDKERKRSNIIEHTISSGGVIHVAQITPDTPPANAALDTVSVANILSEAWYSMKLTDHEGGVVNNGGTIPLHK